MSLSNSGKLKVIKHSYFSQSDKSQPVKQFTFSKSGTSLLVKHKKTRGTMYNLSKGVFLPYRDSMALVGF